MKVAFIGTGGTISSVAEDSLDILDYGRHGVRLEADAILAAVPQTFQIADIMPIRFREIESSDLTLPVWLELARKCTDVAEQHADLAGIVVGHGTSTLEETAYFLSLVLDVAIPVVMVGSQRPLSGLSSDAPVNLVNAVRVAMDAASRGRGVLVVLNDEIQAARDVTKTSTARLQAFRTPDFGILGQVDGPFVRYYRRTERRHAPDTEFHLSTIDALPRVDIAYSYAGADGTAIRAFMAAGASGIVQAAFAPGMATAEETAALVEAVQRGVTIVQSNRVGGGYTLDGERQRHHGFLSADNLSPQKARILLSLALNVTRDPVELKRMFATY